MMLQRSGGMRHAQTWKFWLALCAIGALCIGGFDAPSTAQAIDTGNEALAGSVATLAQMAQKLGPHAAGAQMRFSVVLAPRNQQGIDALVRQLYDPHSPRYHHWLATGEFARLFGPTSQQQASVTNYLSLWNVRLDAAPDPFVLQFTGTTTQVAAALHAQVNDYRLPDGTMGYANASAITLPAAVRTNVAAVVGLDTLNDQHGFAALAHATTGQPHYGGGPHGAGLTPQQIASMYGMGALRGAGAGTTIALFELTNYQTSDVTQYTRHFGLHQTPVTTITTDGGPTDAAGAFEAELDLELATGLANGANRILVYNGPNTDQGLVDQYLRIANDNRADIVSTSWGQCEASTPASTRDAEYVAFAQMALQGQSIVAAAGDNGAFDCLGTGGTHAAQVDDPASQPYVTAVGATSFYHTYDPGSAANPGYPTAYRAEYVWNTNKNCSASKCVIGASGGGISQVWARPAYQVGLGVASHARRQVPDVAIDGDPYSGYGIYCTDVAGQCSFDKKTPAGWFGAGGTSAAATVWATILARVDSAHHRRLGLLNFAAYGLRGDFHDLVGGSPTGIVGGQVTRNGLYAEGVGYDLATGLGSPRVAALLRDFP